jgi:membrane-associated phospholipid phosphatase
MSFERFSKKGTLTILFIAAVYLTYVTFAMELRSDHFLFLGICLLLYFGNRSTRKFFFGLILFAIYWIIYDSLRVFPNYEFNPVSIQELYELEKRFFGFSYRGAIVTPNEFWAMNELPLLDLLCGIFYLSWVPVPLMFSVWLFFNDKRSLIDFTLAFVITNLLGFVVYYLYPAAPPWYVEIYGFVKDFSVSPNAAGLINVDAILGVNFFENLYTRNSNVFAAVPSMHAAFPIISLYFAWRKRMKLTSLLFLIVSIGIWFSAIYTRHHYIIDVLVGAVCAIGTLLFYEKVLLKSRADAWIDNYVSRHLTN